MTDNEPCGYETAEGTPCQLSGSRDDGRCHLHTDINPASSGRSPKFTDDRKQRLIDAAERGTSKEGCARAAGIHPSTLYDWLADSDPEKEEFSEAFRRARARGEEELLDEVKQRNPQFILERSYEYFNTERREVDGEHEHEHSGEVGVSVPQETAERIANAFVYGDDGD